MENNNNYLFELIQDIQSKLNDEKPSTQKEKSNNNNCNQEDIPKNKNNNDNDNSNSNFNISDILNNLNLSGILGNDDSGFDINTIIKIQKILSEMNKDNPRKNLLISLKPFLRKSRQEKINEYLKYISIGSILGIFNEKGSDNNVT